MDAFGVANVETIWISLIQQLELENGDILPELRY